MQLSKGGKEFAVDPWTRGSHRSQGRPSKSPPSGVLLRSGAIELAYTSSNTQIGLAAFSIHAGCEQFIPVDSTEVEAQLLTYEAKARRGSKPLIEPGASLSRTDRSEKLDDSQKKEQHFDSAVPEKLIRVSDPGFKMIVLSQNPI